MDVLGLKTLFSIFMGKSKVSLALHNPFLYVLCLVQAAARQKRPVC